MLFVLCYTFVDRSLIFNNYAGLFTNAIIENLHYKQKRNIYIRWYVFVYRDLYAHLIIIMVLTSSYCSLTHPVLVYINKRKLILCIYYYIYYYLIIIIEIIVGSI